MLGRVAIVLVNYNGKKYLNDFMKSVYGQSYSNISIVLVDNASEDGSVQWVEASYPAVQIIRMEQNEGFGHGCNVGIDYAMSEGADYILLLNTDTVLEINLIEKLIGNIDNNTVVTATIYCGDKEDKKLWYAGGKINYETAKVDQLLYVNGENETYEVDFISGCCMMFHRNIIEQIGGFDTRFYLYYEDVDFCVRLKQHGIKMKYITTTSLWHKVGGSSLGGNEMSCSTQYYVTRNRLLFAEKYSQYFAKGNLEIPKKILQEYAFFDGADNEQYEMFVHAAISDYFKEKFGKGFYGRILLEEHFFVHEGLGEREEDSEKFWYCAKDTRASISIVNSKKKNIIYKISFDIENINYLQDGEMIVEIEGTEAGRYKLSNHIEIRMFLEAEQSKKISIILPKKNDNFNIGYSDKTIYYQLLNIKAEEQAENYYLGNSFMPEESDGQDRWCWSEYSQGSIYLINDRSEIIVEEIAFEVVPYKAEGGKEVAIYQDGVRLSCAEEEKRVYLRVMVSPQKISKIEIRTDHLEEEGGKFCFNVHNLSVNRIEKNYYMGNSFMPEESDGENNWYWSGHAKGSIYLINNKEAVTVEEVAFEVVPYKAGEEKEVTIYQDGVKLAHVEEGKRVCLRVMILPQRISELEIRTDYLEEEGETRCFNVHNLSVTHIDKNYYMGNSFMQEESDGENNWYWSGHAKGSIYLINNKEAVTVEEVAFEVVPYKAGEEKEVTIYQDGVKLAHVEEGKRVCLRVMILPQRISELEIRTDYLEEEGETRCFNVHNLSVTHIDKNYYMGNSFMQEESDGENSWYWSEYSEGSIYLINDKDVIIVEEVSFEIVLYKAGEGKEVEVYQDGVELAHAREGKRVHLRVMIPPQRITQLEIRTEYLEQEERKERRCFNVHNLSVNRINRNYCMGNSFLPEESDGQSRWCWSDQPEGKVYFINDKKTVTVEEVAFEVVPYKMEEGKKIVIYQNESEMARTGIGERVCLWIVVPPESSSKIIINTDFQIGKVDEAKLCFGVYNLTITKLKKSIKYDESFYLQEGSGECIWRWCSEKEAEILFVLNEGKNALISFIMSCDQRYLNETLQVIIDDEQEFEFNYNRKICIPVSYEINRPVHKVLLKVNHLPYKVKGDDRIFTFQLLNFLIEEIE